MTRRSRRPKQAAPDPAPPEQAPPWANPLRGALALVRARPRMWLLLALPGFASVGLDSLVAAAFPDKPYMRFVLQPIYLPMGILAWLCGLAMTSAMSLLVVGVPVSTVREAFARLAQRMQALVGLGCLGTAMASVPALVLLGVASRATQLRPPAGLFQPPIYLAWILVMGAVGIRLGFALHAVLLTTRGPVAALQHSWALTRGHFLKLVPYATLMAAPGLAWAVYRVVVPSAGAVPKPPDTWGLAWSLVALIGVLWQIYATALALLLWYRLRAESEQLTLASAAREIGVRLPKP